MYAHHGESSASLSASAAQLFAHLDDQTRLSAHMSKRSWKMGWGKMETVLDAQRGQAVGSHILLRGRVFGLSLHLDEVVTLRDPPLRKTWETVGTPRLLVIGRYRMGFEITPAADRVMLRVAIDYDLPEKGVARMLGALFGRSYAAWCTGQMVGDAQSAWGRGKG